MNYQEAIDFLFAQLPMYQRTGPSAYKANLDNSLVLDKHFNSPHRNFPTIHVGGTNGKGSISHMLASVFQANELKTGLYTSPHLISFRERIKINGKQIPEEYVKNFVNQNQKIIQKLKPSFFELTVAMAFKYFSDENVDIAIIEVGLGGRLDSTNIIQPVLSIISNISLDHTNLLGNTIEAIAIEKAGIIKRNTPIIIGEYQNEITHIFNETSKVHNAPLMYADQTFSIPKLYRNKTNAINGNIYKNEDIYIEDFSCDLLGEYQRKNIVTSVAALEYLKNEFSISMSSIKSGLSVVSQSTQLLGRWQTISISPLTICDTAHNIAGLSEVIQQIEQSNFNQLHMIIGFVNDKEVSQMLAILPKNAHYYFTEAKIPRALNRDSLYELASKYDLIGEVCMDVQLALKTARKNSTKNDFIFIGGSTFIVAELFEK